MHACISDLIMHHCLLSLSSCESLKRIDRRPIIIIYFHPQKKKEQSLVRLCNVLCRIYRSKTVKYERRATYRVRVALLLLCGVPTLVTRRRVVV